jgi:hypothetical protein
VSYRAVGLSARDVQLYYSGFSNRTLWPLFPLFIGPHAHRGADLARVRAGERAFCRGDLRGGARGSIVWVHDYQLLLVPGLIRRRAPGATIGFFPAHSFPATDVFRILPWARPVLRGLLGADHIGFHTTDYAQHFLVCAERLLGCDVDFAAGTVEIDGGPSASAPIRSASTWPSRSGWPPPPAAGARARARDPGRRSARLHQGHPRTHARHRAAAGDAIRATAAASCSPRWRCRVAST